MLSSRLQTFIKAQSIDEIIAMSDILTAENVNAIFDGINKLKINRDQFLAKLDFVRVYFRKINKDHPNANAAEEIINALIQQTLIAKLNKKRKLKKKPAIEKVTFKKGE